MQSVFLKLFSFSDTAFDSDSFEFFTNYTQMPILAFLSLLREPPPLPKKKSSTILFYTNLTSACKTETFRFPYIVMLYLFPLNSSKSKHQVVHEQKFKDLHWSTCQVSVERIVLNLESEVLRGLGSIPTGGNILSLEFFVFTQ